MGSQRLSFHRCLRDKIVMDGWMNGWVGGPVSGWMDRWVDG